MRKSLTPEALTDVTHDWLVKQKDAEPHKSGWLVGDCWMDRESVRAHAETCETCRDWAYLCTQWRAEEGTQHAVREVSGETFVVASEFTLLPPEDIADVEAKRYAVVDWDSETLRVDGDVVDEDDPMYETYWAAINAAEA